MKIHQLIKYIKDDKDLYQYVKDHVHDKPRVYGIEMYQTLCSLLDYFVNDELRFDYISDILDALTGYCHPSCIIGTGDYHIDEDK